jgi:hypothetical protein
LYESIDKISKLENEMSVKEGMEKVPENIQYKNTVDRMAKHIVYGNIVIIIHYMYCELNYDMLTFYYIYVNTIYLFIN